MFDPQDVGRLYDKKAECLELLFGENLHFGYWPDQENNDFAEARLRLTDLLISNLQVGSDSRVLDVGCGTGGPAVRLARETGAEVAGVTISARQCERASARAEAEGLADRVSFLRADAMKMPFKPSSFDAVFALESIMHMPHRPTVLLQMSQLVRPGGRVALTDIFRTEALGGDELLDMYMELNFVTLLPAFRDYERLVAETGMVVVELSDITEGTIRPTFRHLAQAGRAYSEELESIIGSEMVGMFETMCSVNAETEAIGCLFLVCQRAG